MKKRLTRGERLLFAAPLLFLILAGVVWRRQKQASLSLKLPGVSSVTSLAFSPDGRRVVLAFRGPKTRDYEHRVYDLESRSLVCELAAPPTLAIQGIKGDYQWIAWSPDSKSLVASSRSSSKSGKANRFAIWDAQTGLVKVDTRYSPPDKFRSRGDLHFSPDGKTLIGEGAPPALYDATTGKTLNRQIAGISRYSLARTNEKLGLYAVEDTDHNFIRVFDSQTRKVVWCCLVRTADQFEWYGDILCVTDNDSSRIYSPHNAGRLWLWDGKTRKLLPSPPIPFPVSATLSNGAFVASSFNPDKQSIATFYEKKMLINNVVEEGELVVWDYRQNRVLWRTMVTQGLRNLQWSPDGKWLSVQTIGEQPQNCVLVFDKSGQLRFEFQPVNSAICWSPDSKKLITVAVDNDSAGTNSGHLEIHRIAE